MAFIEFFKKHANEVENYKKQIKDSKPNKSFLKSRYTFDIKS